MKNSWILGGLLGALLLGGCSGSKPKSGRAVAEAAPGSLAWYMDKMDASLKLFPNGLSSFSDPEVQAKKLADIEKWKANLEQCRARPPEEAQDPEGKALFNSLLDEVKVQLDVLEERVRASDSEGAKTVLGAIVTLKKKGHKAF